MVMPKDKVTVKTFSQMKKSEEKIAVLTAYDFFTARILDKVGIDCILVGDSANMVFYGSETTLSIGMDQMIYHTRAVSSACERAMVVGDMPFLSYQTSESEAIRNAGRFLKEGGAQGIKIEGGIEMLRIIQGVVQVGIPVMGHIGLIPQSIHKFGSFSIQGKDQKSKDYLVKSAQALEKVGCFSIVLEAMPSDLAKTISQSLKIPTIGIGAGRFCDGQVLVVNDILGLFEDFKPKFVRRYANLGEEIKKACQKYLGDVKSGSFPSEEESY
jgi:3-methyl-2-oxobutanoate hydroxymethyltransferase